MKASHQMKTETEECVKAPNGRKIFGVTLGVVLVCFVLGFGVGKLLYWIFN